MNFRFTSSIAATVFIIASIYTLSSTPSVFVEARKTVTEISCYPQDNGKTRCCGSEVDDKLVYGYTGVTYCTTCDDTNPPSHCTPREKIGREGTVKPGTDVLNALKGSKGLDVKTPSATTDNTKLPKNFTSKANELLKDGANIETNNPPPQNSNDTLK
jgi:hypothetical protein